MYQDTPQGNEFTFVLYSPKSVLLDDEIDCLKFSKNWAMTKKVEYLIKHENCTKCLTEIIFEVVNF
jgi:hypothetical protein